VNTRPSSRLLSIGEFAAATQLSPKALRLYDEQRLLPPANIDAASGYRYYRPAQVAQGRLIRTLRDMGLSLVDIAGIVAVDGVKAETLLSELAKELDREYAREKRAFQEALVLLRRATRSDTLVITERARPAMTVVVRSFTADRRGFVERFLEELRSTEEILTRAGITPAGEACCSLIDPLSDEEGRLEVVIPILTPAELPARLSVRRLSDAPCAALVVDARDTHASDLKAALDALFDWFDRRGHHAIDAPLVSIDADDRGLRTEIVWAYEPGSQPAR
jgi:DNA-binding transcriptional MerR regulator